MSCNIISLSAHKFFSRTLFNEVYSILIVLGWMNISTCETDYIGHLKSQWLTIWIFLLFSFFKIDQTSSQIDNKNRKISEFNLKFYDYFNIYGYGYT